MTRPVPLRTWFGSLLVVASQAATLARIELFYFWHTPIAWTGYILAVDGLVWKRRGSSWLSDARAEFLFLAFVSVPLWIVFEMYNKYAIHNWHYIGLPEVLLLPAAPSGPLSEEQAGAAPSAAIDSAQPRPQLLVNVARFI